MFSSPSTFLLVILLSSFPLSSLTTAYSSSSINPLLHHQALSHFAFHADRIKLHLAKLFYPPVICIVGVEWGSDLTLFAANNYSVYAFEPATKFFDYLKTNIDHHPEWNVSLFKIAAGRRSGSQVLDYDNESVKENVEVGRVDHYVRETLGVYSLDIQGDELDALEGSTALFKDAFKPASLWIEAIACNEKVIQVLDLLNDNYIVFDFVPWGMPKDSKQQGVPKTLHSFLFYPQRPSRFQEYWDWMCWEKKRAYDWLQTDFLFVRRDLMTEEMAHRLAMLAEAACDREQLDCWLKALLMDMRDGEGKNEL